MPFSPLPWMLIAVTATVTAAHKCSTAAEGPSSSTSAETMPTSAQSFTRLLSANTSGFAEQSELVIRDADALANAWRTLHNGVPGNPAPTVDLSTQMVVLLALGQRNTGGFTIHFDSMTVGAGGGVVRYTVTSPGPTCATIQMVTSPVDVVSVPRVNGTIRFDRRAVVEQC